MVCKAIDIDRVLTNNEVALIQQVASTLDGSINVVTQKREGGMKVILVYDALIMYCVIQSLKTLITGLSTLYTAEQCQEPSHPRASLLPQTEAVKAGKSPEPVKKLEPVKKQEPVKRSEPTKKVELEKKPESEKKETAAGEPSPVENAGDASDTFERPLSLKGQRHVFLYKCRYNQLKAIIDRTGCWGLRMASLTDKWPCLVVYCAKDRETWMNAFHKIQKLERTDFLRRKIADSLKSVDLKRLEELTTTYGQKYNCLPSLTHRNACISLCVQSPSSPSNPSVSVCGIESYVEQLYKIFIEYHLIAEEETDAASTSVSPRRPLSSLLPSLPILLRLPLTVALPLLLQRRLPPGAQPPALHSLLLLHVRAIPRRRQRHPRRLQHHLPQPLPRQLPLFASLHRRPPHATQDAGTRRRRLRRLRRLLRRPTRVGRRPLLPGRAEPVDELPRHHAGRRAAGCEVRARERGRGVVRGVLAVACEVGCSGLRAIVGDGLGDAGAAERGDEDVSSRVQRREQGVCAEGESVE